MYVAGSWNVSATSAGVRHAGLLRDLLQVWWVGSWRSQHQPATCSTAQMIIYTTVTLYKSLQLSLGRGCLWMVVSLCLQVLVTGTPVPALQCRWSSAAVDWLYPVNSTRGGAWIQQRAVLNRADCRENLWSCSDERLLLSHCIWSLVCLQKCVCCTYDKLNTTQLIYCCAHWLDERHGSADEKPGSVQQLDVKVVRFQPLAALLMSLFLASSPLSTLKTVGGRDKHKSGSFYEASLPVTEQNREQMLCGCVSCS